MAEVEIRVQNIASISTDKIPSEFSRSETEQPRITTVKGESLSVPIIDINGPDQAEVLNSIAEASSKWGMFQIVNHEIPDDVMEEAGRMFFELPQEVYAEFEERGRV